ncbi:unnamed protein product [Rhizoctonia solani]|uniref:CFEM domain-containing protein n=1 Tax=Rhizoctonia solani TaxID=456999 RepID=A0A8H3CHV0_9AGAM|nr:unnamed protein product [Rhizoctonia solani]
MRLPIVLTLALAMTVLGQTSSSEPEESTITAEPEPEPESTPWSWSSETQFSITPAPESTTMSTMTAPPLSTAAPPSGGGPTCVQRCLAQSAASVGCSSGADLACLCNSQTYLSRARTCFTDSGCEEAVSQAAVQDYGRACSATSSTPVETSESTWSTTTSRTRSLANVPSVTSFTTRTIAFTSGAVVSISRGVSSTITSGFTTIRTERAGDFGTGGGLAPTSGPDSGSANNSALGVNVGHLGSAGMMMGLGLIGGIAVLVF